MNDLIKYSFNSTLTLSPIPSNISEPVAYVFIFVSCLFWGGNYLPVKHYDTGDGVFFQFVVCISVWVTGVFVHSARLFPKFYGLPAIGGALWTLGNMFSVPIIKFLGIGVGSVFWNIIGMLINWAIARFGLFGVAAQVPNKPVMNYVGVALTVVSIITFLFVKTESVDQMNISINSPERRPLLESTNQPADYMSLNSANTIQPNQTKSRLDLYLDTFSDRSKKIIGTVLSIFAGAMFGVSYVPIMYMQNHYENASQDYNDYIYSYCSGIFIMSIFVFVVYCIYERNKPKMYPEAILPGFLTGLLWGIANTCYNLSTNSLSMAVTVPITNCGPSAVAFIIGFIYREIKGCKNILVLTLGTLFAAIGSILCGFSRI